MTETLFDVMEERAVVQWLATLNEEFGYADNCVGAVDMAKYRAWLEANYGLKLLPSLTEGSSVVCQPT